MKGYVRISGLAFRMWVPSYDGRLKRVFRYASLEKAERLIWVVENDGFPVHFSTVIDLKGRQYFHVTVMAVTPPTPEQLYRWLQVAKG